MQKLMGAIIKQERQSNKLSQQHIADKMKCSVKYVSHVENGRKNITAAVFEDFLVASGSDKKNIFHPRFTS
ncbi:MAG: helix-turn-helix transcriptional regulator [Bacteroidetes bacterium]|nr:helix-turn-helix transcriptional regulator [Bacteroidota bacterium]